MVGKQVSCSRLALSSEVCGELVGVAAVMVGAEEEGDGVSADGYLGGYEDCSAGGEVEE
jgi:hypothetical protein